MKQESPQEEVEEQQRELDLEILHEDLINRLIDSTSGNRPISSNENYNFFVDPLQPDYFVCLKYHLSLNGLKTPSFFPMRYS